MSLLKLLIGDLSHVTSREGLSKLVYLSVIIISNPNNFPVDIESSNF